MKPNRNRQSSVPAPPDARSLPAFLRWQDDACLLSLKVQPRASRNEIGESLGAELKVKITAPPVDSAANDALIRFLAEILHCPRSQVNLVRGHTARHKVVRVAGRSVAQILVSLGQVQYAATERCR